MFAPLLCSSCGLPFSSPELLENHQRRFCVASRVDREANQILERMGYAPSPASAKQLAFSGGVTGYPSAPAPLGPTSWAMQVQHQPQQHQYPASPMMYRNSAPPRATLPSVDMELFQLIKTQQQQILLMQNLMGVNPGGTGGNRSPRAMPFAHGGGGGAFSLPAYGSVDAAGPQQLDGFRAALPSPPQMVAPLATATGDSSLTEGRYGLSLIAAEGMEALLTCDATEANIVVREYVASVDPQKLTPRGTRSRGQHNQAPALLLESRGDRSFGPQCMSVKLSKKQRHGSAVKLKDVETSFSVLQNRELHVFLVEFYAPDGRLLAWADVTIDALGEKARPLRTGPVDLAAALRNPTLRLIPGALVGLESFRTSWKQQQQPQRLSHRHHHHRGARSHKHAAAANSASSSSSSSDDDGGDDVASESTVSSAARLPKRKSDGAAAAKPPSGAAQASSKNGTTDQKSPTPALQRAGSSSPTATPATERRTSLRRTPTPDLEGVKVGKGPDRDAGRIAIDAVVGVPMNVICTRVCVYFASTVDKSDNSEQFPLGSEGFFIRAPEVVCYQTLDSSSLEPVFLTEHNIVVGPKTAAVAIVECMEPKKGRFTLGHAILPVSQESNAGNFMTRLFWGDPRASHLRSTDKHSKEDDDRHRLEVERYDATQLNSSLLSREMLDALASAGADDPRRTAGGDISRYWPCAYVKWRADSSDRNRTYREPAGQLPMTPAEAQLQKERQQLPSQSLHAQGITTQEKLVQSFGGKSCPVDDNISFVAPYVPSRGIFVLIEGLRGMTTERCLYKVTAEVVSESGTVLSQFTTRHDFSSDLGCPLFLDEPFVFPKAKNNPNAIVLFRVLKMMDPSTEQPGGIMPFAWTATKIFVENNVARHGRFAVPLYAGVPMPKVLDEMKTERIDQVMLRWTTNPPSGSKLEYLKPYSLLVFCQGDALRSEELTKQRDPFRIDPRTLLVPSRLKREFPCQDDEGYHEVPLSTVIEDGKSPAAFEEAMNKQLKLYFKKL